MKITGIITEYNPFHNGHAYQIEQIRKQRGEDTFIIAAMSGDFVQRGAPAIACKYTRTRMALSAGADLVVELPALWATASAEYFAMAGVSLFHRMGCVDELCFGVETDNLPLLSQLASVLCEEPDEYRALLASHLKNGESFPLARTHAMTDYFNGISKKSPDFCAEDITALLSSPNNILAIEYMKALKRLDSPIRPVPLLRAGAGYHDTDIEASLASATAIRNYLLENTSRYTLPDNGCLLQSAIPPQAYSVFCSFLKKSPVMTADDFSMLLGYELLKTPSDELAAFADCNQDIANRIKKNLAAYQSFSMACEQNKSRDITYTRISRIFTHLLLDIRKEDYDRAKQLGYVPYIRPLGFRKASAALFSEIKKHTSLPLVSKLSNADGLLSQDALWLLSKDIFAADVYEQVLAQKKGTTPRSEYAREMVLL